jgi:hypothetical protein
MPSPDPQREADRAVIEAGGGEAEGFEQAEEELIEHASHGDQHAARRIAEDAIELPEEPSEGGEADEEWTSEKPDDSR